MQARWLQLVSHTVQAVVEGLAFLVEVEDIPSQVSLVEVEGHPSLA